MLISPGGTKQVTLFGTGALSGRNLTGTVLDDSAQFSITTGVAPYTGSFQSTTKGLSALNGLSASGTWTLHLVDSKQGNTGTLKSWSLKITPALTVTPNNPDASGNATSFTIGFPRQQLGGTYSVQLGPNILDAAGEPLDTNQNAGLDVLRGQAMNVPTVTVNYGASNLGLTIPAASGSTPGQVSSTINVPDNFLIQGLTAANRGGIRVSFNITHPDDPSLTAILYYHKGQSDEKSITLFSGVGGGPTTANFNDTVLDDNLRAKTPIHQGERPVLRHLQPAAVAHHRVRGAHVRRGLDARDPERQRRWRHGHAQ